MQGGRFGSEVVPPAPPAPPPAPVAAPPAPIMQTLQGGRFNAPAPAPAPARRPPAPEPSDEDLRRAVGKGGGSGKWIALIIAGLAVGGGVGWYFGVYEPEQRRLTTERRSRRASRKKRASKPSPPSRRRWWCSTRAWKKKRNPMRASRWTRACPGCGRAGRGRPPDAGVPDAGAPVAPTVPVVDAGTAAPVVQEPKKSFDWYVAQGDRLRERDKPEQALDFYGKASDLKPERVEPITGRGLALLDMANPSAAAATFESALKLNSRYGPAIMGLAEAYRIQGKNEKAVEYYQRYLDVLPNGAEAAVARSGIERLARSREDMLTYNRLPRGGVLRPRRRREEAQARARAGGRACAETARRAQSAALHEVPQVRHGPPHAGQGHREGRHLLQPPRRVAERRRAGNLAEGRHEQGSRVMGSVLNLFSKSSPELTLR